MFPDILPIFSWNSRARPGASGSGISTLFSNLLRIAESSCQGRLVAPSTRMPSMSLPTPSICTRNSVLTLLDASFSPSPLAPQSESISSIKTIEGLLDLAISKRDLTKRSDSPCHFEIRSDAATLKKVASASAAHTLARNDLPVPGGPYIRMPRQGLIPLSSNILGNFTGRITASLSAALAPSSPATSSQWKLGFSLTIADSN